jgi:hypothetical protein
MPSKKERELTAEADALLAEVGFDVDGQAGTKRSFKSADLEEVDAMCATDIGGNAILWHHCPSNKCYPQDGSQEFPDNVLSLVEHAYENAQEL